MINGTEVEIEVDFTPKYLKVADEKSEKTQ